MNNEEIIMDVLKRIKKNPFGYMTEEDIEQEAWIIINSIMKNWDNVRPLENFLMCSVTRRLKSLSRHYYRSEAKRKSIDFVEEQDVAIDNIIASNEETINEIASSLPDELRADFFRLVGGTSIPAPRKLSLLLAIRKNLYG